MFRATNMCRQVFQVQQKKTVNDFQLTKLMSSPLLDCLWGKKAKRIDFLLNEKIAKPLRLSSIFK